MLDGIPSRVAIILCKRDFTVARACLETWIHAGNSLDEVIQVSTDGTLLDGVEALIPQGIPQSHPEAPNRAFQYLVEKAYGSFSFLFTEADCVFHPIRAKGLLQTLEAELVARGGRILATPTHVKKVGWTMSGVSFYPHDIRKHIDLEELPNDVPFDHFLRNQVYPDLLSPTNRIVQAPFGGVTGVQSLGIFGPVGAVHHGCKDLSLADLCLKTDKQSLSSSPLAG